MRLVAVILVSAIMHLYSLDCSPVLIPNTVSGPACFVARLASIDLAAPDSTVTSSLFSCNTSLTLQAGREARLV